MRRVGRDDDDGETTDEIMDEARGGDEEMMDEITDEAMGGEREMMVEARGVEDGEAAMGERVM